MKIANHQAPQYLIDLLPEKIGITRPGSRHADDFKLMKTRTETFKNSFIPASVKEWIQG